MVDTIYIATDPTDASQVHDDNSIVSFDSFVRKLMMSCGASPLLLPVLLKLPEAKGAESDAIAYSIISQSPLKENSRLS